MKKQGDMGKAARECDERRDDGGDILGGAERQGEQRDSLRRVVLTRSVTRGAGSKGCRVTRHMSVSMQTNHRQMERKRKHRVSQGVSQKVEQTAQCWH